MNKDNRSPDMSKLSEQLKALAGNRELVIRLLDLLPIPIQIFTPDGTCTFINRAYKDTLTGDMEDNVVGKYNYNNDPICFEILGQDVYDKVSRGEAVFFPNFCPPIQDTVNKGYIKDKPWEAAATDVFFLPLWDGGTFAYTIMFYTVKKVYQGKPEIVNAVQYMDIHWRDEFNLDNVARVANISRRHFQFLFKNTMKMTHWSTTRL